MKVAILGTGEVGKALALSGNDSDGEQVQRWLPQSKVVKAFNSVGHTLGRGGLQAESLGTGVEALTQVD